MYRKNCQNCQRPSYSSSEFGEWICPVCGNDLTSYAFFDAITFERLQVPSKSNRQKLEKYERGPGYFFKDNGTKI